MDQISPSTAGAGIMPPAPGGGGGGGVAEGLPVEGAAGTGGARRPPWPQQFQQQPGRALTTASRGGLAHEGRLVRCLLLDSLSPIVVFHSLECERDHLSQRPLRSALVCEHALEVDVVAGLDSFEQTLPCPQWLHVTAVSKALMTWSCTFSSE